MFLEELTNLPGVSGNEEAVKAFIYDQVKEQGHELIEDAMGNLMVIKRCKDKAAGKEKAVKKVMLSAHMDEVGFMVSEITEQGMLKFVQAGGVDEKILPGLLLKVGEGALPAVCFEGEGLFLDIGAMSREEAMEKVSLGDYVTFASPFQTLGNRRVKAKAFDDRVGCAILLELLMEDYPFDLYACFTVQEEIGLRGSEVAAHRVAPQLAFVVEGTTCSDLSHVDPLDVSSRLGEGPVISILDKSTYYHQGLHRAIKNLAQKEKIKLQIKNTFTGGNDAGKIQRANEGTLVAVVSLPIRYIHSPTSVMSLFDYEESLKLLTSMLTKINFDSFKEEEL